MKKFITIDGEDYTLLMVITIVKLNTDNMKRVKTILEAQQISHEVKDIIKPIKGFEKKNY